MKILDSLMTRYPALSRCRNDISSAIDAVITCYESSGKVLVCGNGGSASDSEHIAGELLKGFMKRRPLDRAKVEAIEKAFPGESVEISANLQEALPCIALTSHVALSTAFANDVNPDYTFAQQVLAFGRRGDVLVCISTSGNAKNVANAAKVAKSLGILVIGLTGIEGGRLRTLSDILVAVPEEKTYLVQEYHLPVYHAICQAVEEKFFPV